MSDRYDFCSDAPLPPNLIDAWIQFFTVDKDRQPGHDLYEDIFDNGWLFPLQRKRELEKMMALARTIQPGVVMEIGADKGSGFYHWIKCHPTVRRAIACEIRGVPYANLFNSTFPQVDILDVPTTSLKEETRNFITQWLGEDKIDCLFLDGAKSFFHRDFELYSPLVRSGGLIFMHDVNEGGPHQSSPPAKFFRELNGNLEKTMILDTSEVEEVTGRKQLGMPLNAYQNWLLFWNYSSCGVGVVKLR